MLSCDPSRLFGMDIKGRDCGDEAAQWFTSFLKTEAFRLVQFEKHMKGRPSKEIFSPVVPNYQVSSQSAALLPVAHHPRVSGFLLDSQRTLLGIPVKKVQDWPR